MSETKASKTILANLQKQIYNLFRKFDDLRGFL